MSQAYKAIAMLGTMGKPRRRHFSYVTWADLESPVLPTYISKMESTLTSLVVLMMILPLACHGLSSRCLHGHRHLLHNPILERTPLEAIQASHISLSSSVVWLRIYREMVIEHKVHPRDWASPTTRFSSVCNTTENHAILWWRWVTEAEWERLRKR